MFTTTYTPATSVIDPTAPGGIEAMIEFHRATFGDARMEGEGAGGGDGAEGGAQGVDPNDSASGSGSQGEAPAETGTQGAAGETGAGEPQNVDELPGWAQKLVRDARAEAANNRVKAKDGVQQAAQAARDEVVQSIGKALGLIKDETDNPDPAELTKQIESEREAANSARVELATYRAASKHGADPDALLDSRAFTSAVNKLDPTAEDFASQVDEAIKTAVENNSKLRVAQAAAGRAGGDFSAGNADSSKGQLNREQLAKLSPSERLKAAKEGRVANLIGSK